MRHPARNSIFQKCMAPWSLPAILKTVGQVRGHVLYKRPEIPANKANPAFAVSVTYRKRRKAANTGSIPVSATNIILRINNLQIGNSLTGNGPEQRLNVFNNFRAK